MFSLEKIQESGGERLLSLSLKMKVCNDVNTYFNFKFSEGYFRLYENCNGDLRMHKLYANMQNRCVSQLVHMHNVLLDIDVPVIILRMVFPERNSLFLMKTPKFFNSSLQWWCGSCKHILQEM